MFLVCILTSILKIELYDGEWERYGRQVFDVEMFWYGVSNKNNVIYKKCLMSVMIGP